MQLYPKKIILIQGNQKYLINFNFDDYFNTHFLRTRLVDASTMVMEGCISCIIDLHSSDDPEIYQVFLNLQTLDILRETSGIFRNKV